MTVTVTKAKLKETKKTKPAAKVGGDTAQSLLAKAADELGALKKTIDAQKKELKKNEDAYKKILDPIVTKIDEELGAGDVVEGNGDTYVATVGARANQSAIKDVRKAYNYMKAAGGVDLLLKTLKFNITDLKNYLTSSEITEVLQDERTGPRKVNFTQK